MSIFHPSTHPSSPASSSLSRRCFTRIPRLCQVFGLVLVVFSDSLDRLSIHPRFLVFIPSFALWVSMFRDLCSVRIFISAFSLGLLRPTCNRVCFHASAPEKSPHRFRLCLVSLFDLVLSLEFAINSFLSRTILVSNLVPLRLLLPLVLSVVQCSQFFNRLTG